MSGFLTENEFEELDDTTQLAYLTVFGTFLLGRNEKKTLIELYAVNKFYVEVLLHKSKPAELKIISDEKLFELYRDQLNIDALLRCVR